MPRLTPEDQLRIAKRRMEIARMYLQGKAQIEIAEKLQVHPMVVCNDLMRMREEWAEKCLLDFDKRKAEELAKLDRLEAVAWAAWERSAEDANILRDRREYIRERGQPRGRKKAQGRLVPIGRVTDNTTKGQCGDPRFLERIESCIVLRMRVLGILKGDMLNQQILNIDFGALVGRTDEPDPAEQKILEVQRSVGITSQPKHLTDSSSADPDRRQLENLGISAENNEEPSD